MNEIQDSSTRSAEPNGDAAHSFENLRLWLAGFVAQELGVAREEIATDQAFDQFGVDSVQAVNIMSALEDRLGRELEPNLPYRYPTIDQLSRFLAGGDRAGWQEDAW